MIKRLALFCLVLGFLAAPVAQAAKLIWVSDRYDEKVDGAPDDAAGPAFLESQGYTVDYKAGPANGNGYWRTLDAAKIAELNAADVVIISRNLDSGSFANDAPIPLVYYCVDSTLSNAHYLDRLPHAQAADLALIEQDRLDKFSTCKAVRRLPYCVNDKLYYEFSLFHDSKL